MSVYAPLIGHLWRTLQSYGVEPGLAIEAAHYRPGIGSQLSKRISFKDWESSVARGVALVNDPAMGIRSARYIHPSHLGALGHAWMASSTLRDALRRLVRFRQLFNEQVELQVHELPDRISVTYLMKDLSSCADQLSDAHMAGLLNLCRLNFGSDLKPVAVSLTRSEPPDPAPWLDFFGTAVRFGQAENSIAISAKDADTHLTDSDSELLAVYEAIIQRHFLKLGRNNILNRTRLHIMEQLPSGRVTEDDVARQLNITKRTLHRKLKEQNESFRSLLVQVKKDLSARYLQNRDYSITEIAFLLGYTDTSAFSRAFKTWFGCAPTQARDR